MSKKYLDGIDVIYWINLDRANDRRIKMEKLFADPIFEGIKNVRISALDSAKENPRIKFVLNDENLNNINKNTSDIEYAILYSHLEAIRAFSKTNYENAIIFEDDVTLEYKKYWKKTIQEVIDNAPKDWEIIKLNSFAGKIHTKLYNKWEYFELTLPPHIRKNNYKWRNKEIGNDWCAVAYLINNKAAKKLIEKCYDTKYIIPIDIQHTSDTFIYTKLKTYTYKYPFFTYNDNKFSYNIKNKDKFTVRNFKKNIITNMYKNLNKTRKK